MFFGQEKKEVKTLTHFLRCSDNNRGKGPILKGGHKRIFQNDVKGMEEL